MPQSLSRVLVHLIFSTKTRAAVLTPEVRSHLFPYMATVIKNMNSPVIRVGGVEDHVHLLFGLARTTCIAEVVEKVKTSSSKFLKSGHNLPDFAWQHGYAALSVGSNQADAMSAYIAGQVEHHRTRSFAEEYLALLDEHGVEYDEQYMWD